MKIQYCILLLLAVLYGCSSSDESAGFLLSESGMNDNTSIDSNGNPILPEGSKNTTIGGISYRMEMMSALYYLNAKGEKVSPRDREDLLKESVLIFEIQSSVQGEDLFDSEQIRMDKEDAIKYLIGDITKDIVLIQGDNEFTANGVQYDGGMSSSNKFRIFLFYKDLNTSQPIKFKYYDRLFGAGLINLKQEEITKL